MKQSSDFDEILIDEKQSLLFESISKYLKTKNTQYDFICEVYLSIFNSVHDKMSHLKKYIGNELFNSYFKYA